MKKNEIYKCGNGMTIEILSDADSCGLQCCGEPVELLEEKTADAATEKHVPLLEESGDGIKVVVGSTAHPMTEEHYIMWIEVINGDYVNRKHLKPGDAPEAEFYVPKQEGLIVRSYCNLHGLWKG
jgi:superoxide reductase